MKVLYVEDNPANVFLVKRVARMGQHEIINYIDGDQAIQKFNEINPDLVLMDIQLAGDKSGVDVVKELRKRGVTTPIIAVTAYAMVGDRERCIEAGCTDYLAKPLPIPRLVEIFKHYSDIAEAKPTAKVTPTAPVVDPIPETETVESKIATPKETASAEGIAKEEADKTVTTVEKETSVTNDDSSQDKSPIAKETTTTTSTTNDDSVSANVPITKPAVEKETTTKSSINDDSSPDTVSESTIDKPVAPANITNTMESKEEVSTGETS